MADGSAVPSLLRFELRSLDGGFVQHVEARDGEFSDAALEPGSYRIVDVRGDGTRFRADKSDVRVPSQDLAVALVAVPRTVLRVVDGETGVPLRDATVRPSRDYWFPAARAWFPEVETAAAKPLAADTEGRVTLPVEADSDRWMCVAPGYAWRGVVTSSDIGGERVVELERGGDLRLVLRGAFDLPDVHVSMRLPRNGHVNELPRPDETGLLVLRGLPPGVSTVTIRRGERWQGGAVYGEGEVEIVAGVENTLVLDMDSHAADDRVPIRGVVVVAGGWGGSAFTDRLSFTQRDGERARASAALEKTETPLVYRFTTEPLPVGEYEVSLDAYGWCRDVTVTHGTELRLDVGPPVQLEVFVRDATTGDPVPDAEVLWSAIVEPERGGAYWRLPRLPTGKAAFGLQVAPGRVSLHVSSPSHAECVELVEVPEGERNVTVDVDLVGGGSVTVRVVLDGVPYAGDPVSVNIEMSSSSWISMYTRNGEARFESVRVGRREVSIRAPEGHRSAPPRTIEVEAGKHVDVTLELELERVRD